MVASHKLKAGISARCDLQAGFNKVHLFLSTSLKYSAKLSFLTPVKTFSSAGSEEESDSVDSNDSTIGVKNQGPSPFRSIAVVG